MLKKNKILSLAIGFLLIIGLLAGCSDNVDHTTSSEGNKEKLIEEEGIRSVIDAQGETVKVPMNPERIIALHNVGEIMSLGLKPIASSDYYINKFDPDGSLGIESVGDVEISFEKILSLEPDLIIISSYYDASSISELRKIAPTLVTQWGLTPLELLSFLSQSLGRQTEERAWLEKYQERSRELQEQLKPYVEDEPTAIVIQFWDKNIYQHETKVFEGLYNGAGFVPTENAKAVTSTEAISEEAVVSFVEDADYIFIIVEDTENEERYHELKNSIWKNIEAVKNDRVYLVKDGRWNDYSTAAMEWILDDIQEIFIKQ